MALAFGSTEGRAFRVPFLIISVHLDFAYVEFVFLGRLQTNTFPSGFEVPFTVDPLTATKVQSTPVLATALSIGMK